MCEPMQFNILISGVGGQGTVLASRLLAMAAMEAGFFARTAETIGMAQRGGCVVSHVRIGSEDNSPIIPKGKVDLLLGFEMSETVRMMPMLSDKGVCIINTQFIKPVTASLGVAHYSKQQIEDYIHESKHQVVCLDAYTQAKEVDLVKAINVIMIGAAAGRDFLPFSREILKNTILTHVPEKYRDLNLKAFELGVELMN